jgi:cystathionine beta-lyase
MDYEDLDRKLSDPEVKLFILCNPQNPCGRIWNKEELARAGELAERHGVIVISDEIHCDLTDPGKAYQPFAAVNEVCRHNSLTCLAPSKAFNLAGLQTAAVFSSNRELFERARKGFDTDEVSEPGSFAIPAAVAAFRYGEDWLRELNEYIFENKRIVKDFLLKELPEVKVMPSEATYLLWLDIRSLPRQGKGFADHLRKDAGLWLIAGENYGENGNGFLRMNIACPAELVREGLKRLKKGVKL